MEAQSLPSIVLVGEDATPSNALKLLIPFFHTRDFTVHSFFGYGKRIGESELQITERTRNADAILVGSSFPPDRAVKEVSALRVAQAIGIPNGIYFDRYGAINRPIDENIRLRVNYIFTDKGEDVVRAGELFPSAQCIRSGNPEEEEHSVKKYSREEVRAKLGVLDDSFLILVGLHKVCAASLYTAVCLDEALSRLGDQRPESICIRYFPHPTDAILSAGIRYSVELEQYATSGCHARLVPTQEMTTREAIEGADCSIGITGFNTKLAAYHAVPAIEFIPSHMRRRLVSMDGTDQFEPCVRGAAIPIYGGGPDELADALRVVFDPENRAQLVSQQRKAYPPVHRTGEAIEIIGNTIAFQVDEYSRKRQEERI